MYIETPETTWNLFISSQEEADVCQTYQIPFRFVFININCILSSKLF